MFYFIIFKIYNIMSFSFSLCLSAMDLLLHVLTIAVSFLFNFELNII